MKLVPHGEPYAGKLHVRFDEGAGVPHGASRSTLHPYLPRPKLSNFACSKSLTLNFGQQFGGMRLTICLRIVYTVFVASGGGVFIIL